MKVTIEKNRRKIVTQIVEQIKHKIIYGEILYGEQLPQIRKLATELNVSYSSVKRAYSILEQEEFISTLPFKGSYIEYRSEETLHKLNKLLLKSRLEKEIAKAMANWGITKEEVYEIIQAIV